MPDIVTDISINQNWNARKGANNPVTFTFTQSGSAFNISTYTFSVQLRKFGRSTNLLNLTQGSGVTNNGAAGTLNVVFTSANLATLSSDDYYWQMTVVHPDTFSYLWFQGTFNLYSETYTGDLTSAVTGTIDINGTTINTSIALGVVGITDVIAGTNISIDKSDPLNPVISSSGGGSMTYPGAGIALSTGSAWGTSITDNSSNWNTAFGWGNHASAGYITLTGTQALTGNKIITGSGSNFNLSLGDASLGELGAFTVVTSGATTISSTASSTSSLSVGGNTGYLRNGARGFEVSPTGFYAFANAGQYLQGDATGFIWGLGSDATGDTYYRNSSGYFTRLAAGTNGHVLTLAGGIPSWAAPSGGGLTVGTSTITSGTNTRVLYNNSGVLGEYTISGSGNVAMTTSPTFTTPILGTPTSGTLTNTTGYLFNNLAAATGSNTINNAANAQEWQWNTLGSGTGLLLSSSSTAAASNTNTLFRVNQTGANATSTQTTYGGYFSNKKTGTSSTNIGLVAEASGGTNNYAIWAPTGQTRLQDVLFNGSGNIATTSGSTRMSLQGASGSVVIGVAVGNNQTYTSSGGMNALVSQMGWSSSSASSYYSLFTVSPTINVTSGTGSLYGVWYAPTLTSVAGISNHYAFYAAAGDLVINSGNATVSGTLNVGSNYTTQGQIIQNVGTTGSNVYRRNVEWTPVTASGSSGNFDFDIFNTDVIQNSTCTVTITVTGVNSSGVKSYAKEMKATFRKPGTSDPVQVGSTIDIYEHSNDLTTPTSSVSASTDYCRVNYDSGTGAPTLQWTVFIETKYSTN